MKQNIEFNERELSVVKFALWRLMSHALSMAGEAARGKKNKYFKKGDSEAFYKDAKDAEQLLEKLDKL
jgi:hypothetical protein